jgi:hypothetical protein
VRGTATAAHDDFGDRTVLLELLPQRTGGRDDRR